MIIGILAAVAGAAVYFCIRLYMIRKSIRQAARELEEITGQLEENRIIKLTSPNRELEQLLTVMNGTLERIREERISYERREKEFQHQIENISHDLRTPLTAIQGYLTLMAPEQLDSESREALEVVRRRTENLQQLINQFYEYSILIAEDYKLEMGQVDFGRMCREMLLGNYQRLEERGIAVQAEIPDKPVMLWADAQALERILGNLLQNAVRYAKSGFRLQLSEDEEKIEFVLANDTEYLQEKDLPQLFDRFYMSDRSRNQGGTGLGLTISRNLTEKLGGTMTAEMQEEWLTFHVVFYRKGK